MRTRSVLILVMLMLALSPVPARADLTAFLGAATEPVNRQTRGIGIGVSLLIIGFEFEWANIAEDTVERAPAVRTGTMNVLLQAPFPILGIQPYATSGVGLFRERLGTTHEETNVTFNGGGGVKVSLLGPIRARVDYRVLKLRGNPLYSVVHRVYTGLSLSF